MFTFHNNVLKKPVVRPVTGVVISSKRTIGVDKITNEDDVVSATPKGSVNIAST